MILAKPVKIRDQPQLFINLKWSQGHLAWDTYPRAFPSFVQRHKYKLSKPFPVSHDWQPLQILLGSQLPTTGPPSLDPLPVWERSPSCLVLQLYHSPRPVKRPPSSQRYAGGFVWKAESLEKMGRGKRAPESTAASHSLALSQRALKQTRRIMLQSFPCCLIVLVLCKR